MDATLAPILSLLLSIGSMPDPPPRVDQIARPPALEEAEDADGDGVPEWADFCPDTPEGFPVESNGCARDSDGDGVSDGADRCPATSADSVVDEAGCSTRDRKIERPFRYPAAVS